MLKTSNLAQQLKEQISQENETIQSLTKQQLNDMRSELNVIYQQELSTMKADIKRQSKGLGWISVSNRIIWPLIIGISLSIGIFGGSWVTMQYLTYEIITLERNVQTLEKAGGKIEFSKCGKKSRLCAKIDTGAETYQDGYRILEGY